MSDSSADARSRARPATPPPCESAREHSACSIPAIHRIPPRRLRLHRPGRFLHAGMNPQVHSSAARHFIPARCYFGRDLSRLSLQFQHLTVSLVDCCRNLFAFPSEEHFPETRSCEDFLGHAVARRRLGQKSATLSTSIQKWRGKTFAFRASDLLF